MTTSVGRDARKQARGVLELPVVVTDASHRGAGGVRFDAADVSAGGAFLRSDMLFEVGELLTLRFDLPQGGASIRTAGRVIRVSRGQSKEVPGMGVEFVDLQPADRAAIEERLRR